MTDHKQPIQQLSERDVEGVLQQFFAAETPVEFQSDEPLIVTPSLAEPEVVAILPTSSKESRQLAGYMALAVSTICCLLAVFFLPNETGDPPSTSAHKATPPADDTSDFVPVEDREHLRFSKLGDPEDPDSRPSDAEETLAPELEVEIFPLQPDKPK